MIATIKAKMPRTYASIQAKATEIGRQAFAMVRRSIAGEPNLFWAMEAGYVVGTPFAAEQRISADVAQLMVQVACDRVTLWGTVQPAVQHGA